MLDTSILAEYIYTTVQNSSERERDIATILEVLKQRKLTYVLPSLLKHIELLHKRSIAWAQPQITFATEPTKESIDRIKAYIDAPKGDVKIIVEKDLIGGFYAQYKGTIYDGSVRTYLDTIQKTLQTI
jgi:F0F1-type ATP synthase delta subunit